MTKEEIIEKVLQMDPEQLEKVKRFLDLLPDLSENQTDEQEQVHQDSEFG